MNKSATLHYSNDTKVENPVVQVWEDHNTERSGFFRAYWCASPEAPSGSTVFGYCQAGGSWRTIKAVAREVLRQYPDAKIFRNGKLVKY